MAKVYPLQFLVFLICLLMMHTTCFSQNVSINSTGNAPNTSAGLDVDFNNKGVLLPRLTTTERNAISSPAQSLQIFNTTTNCYEVYYGTVWQTASCFCTSAPAAAGSITGTATVCPGQTAVLYTVPAITGANSYTWAYTGTGAVIVGNTNMVIVYFSSNATSGNLTVTGSNACGNGTVSSGYSITVNTTAPSITGQPTSPAAVCPGTGAPSFTVTATGGVSYQWQEYISSWNNILNSSTYSGATTATLTITNPAGSMNGYQYRCVVSGTCVSTTSDGAATLTVTPLPSAAGSISGTATVCQAQNNVSYSVGAISGATSYTWAYSATGATISGSTNPMTINFASNATSGNLTVMGTNICGNGTVSANYVITVNPLPTVAAITGTMSVATGSTTQLSDATSGGVWSSSNTTLAIVNGSGLVTGVADGTPTIIYTVTSGSGCVKTATANVTVYTNGVCGPAGGHYRAIIPTGSDLCSAGTPSSVSGSGPWSWTCNGTNGGSNASCSTVAPTYSSQSITTVGSSNWTVPAGVMFADVFLVGGGGGGGKNVGGGGGGGYTATYSGVAITPGESVPVIVGAGGTAGSGSGGNGGYSEFRNSSYRANGGIGGLQDVGIGGAGGSGGGGTFGPEGAVAGAGGTNGGNGGVNGGNGQGTTTKAFGENTGNAYGGGGGGGGWSTVGGGGGATGGGAGGNAGQQGASGTANTGGGGGGSGSSTTSNTGAGGSGIIMLRYATNY